MATNSYRAQAELQIGNRTYTLQLDTNAVAELEDTLAVTGKMAVFSVALSGSIKGLRATLWVCLRPHHPKLTLKDVGDFLDDEELFARVRDVVLPKLIEDAFPPLRGKLMPTTATPQPTSEDQAAETPATTDSDT